MARDKSKDDKLFNCSQQHEHDYVAGLYSIEKRPGVRSFLINGCRNNVIYHCTHYKVYELIRANLGYPIPN
jgi:hypothetical protein